MPQTPTTNQTLEQKVNAENSLYGKVQAYASESSGKTKIGYTVSTYGNALDALQKLRFIPDEDNAVPILGKPRSYKDVSGMQFNANGFSDDRNAAIWKMQLRQWGAVPLLSSETNRVCIAGTGKETNESRQRNECPFVLDKNQYTEQKFKVGVKVDLTDLGVAYFNEMFCSRGQDDQKIDASGLSALVNSGCLFVEIIFPQADTAAFAGIIGQTSISDNATIYINSCILTCQGWDKFGLTLFAQAGQSNFQVAPSGTGTYKFPLQGNNYNFKQASIQDFGRTKYNEWCNRSGTTSGDIPVKLVQAAAVNVFVRFYIPSEFRGNAEMWLPKNYSHNIYKTYGDLIRESSSVARNRSGGSASVAIKSALDGWINMIYNEKNISTRQYNPQSLRYVIGAGHGVSFKFQGQEGQIKFSSAGQNSNLIAPLFIHQGPNPHHMDCSSFSCCLIYDSGLFDESKELPSFNTSGFKGAAAAWKPLLKPQYDVIDFDIDGTTQIQSGDILYFTADEKGTTYGHAAVVHSADNGVLMTLEINTGKKDNLKVLKRNHRNISEYNHVIRFVDKAQA